MIGVARSCRVLLVLALLNLPGSMMVMTGLCQEGSPERLYIAKGCLGCHGASARGGVGPSIARTQMDYESFLAQLRNPTGIMPAFPEEVVNADEARSIYEYITGLPVAEAGFALEAPTGELDPASCADCHRGLQPTIVRQFGASAMGRSGAQNPNVTYAQKQIGCADCHGVNHTRITASRGRVPETTCAACHPQIYKEHVTDLGHSYGPGPAGIGGNWERNVGVPHYAQMPRKVMEMGCDPCHAQAGATDDAYWDEQTQKYDDTSSLHYRNGCMSCHTRHAFSLAEARRPEACFTCHMGPDHPNYEAYMSSKHGSIYAARGEDWDWSQPLAVAEWETPTCAYCHMLVVDDEGRRYSSHNMTQKIIWGMGVQAALGQLEDITLSEENRAKRNEMVKVCMSCHSEYKARGYLESADAHKLAGDALVVEGRSLLSELYDERLLEPIHGQRSAGLLPGPEFTAIELPGAVAQHWPAGLYYDVSTVEREYFDMFFFSNLKSYKGAFHMSPDYAWWYGYAEVLGHLGRLRDEAEKLRDARSTQEATRFMIVTGPLMVLIVLATVFFIWRAWSERSRRPAAAEM